MDLTETAQQAADPMSEDELLKILREEEIDATSYYDTEFALAQAEAMKRYNGELYGDEVEGRSRIVTHDVEDTINWIMPHLMRTFLSTDELVTVTSNAEPDEKDTQPEDPPKPGEMPEEMKQEERLGETGDDVEAADTKTIGEYLTHIFFKDNDGEVIIHDFAFDGMLQRVGCVKVTWEDPQPSPPKRLEGVPLEQVLKYAESEDYEILAQAMADDGMTYSLEVQKKPRVGRVCIENVPPEEIAWNKFARSPKQAEYIRRKREVYVAEIARAYPEKKAELMSPDHSWNSGGSEVDTDTDARKLARHPETGADDRRATQGWRRAKAYLIEEDIKVDFDGDGIVETRHVKRLGNVILENEMVERSELFFWSPIRIPHKLAGRSVADTMMDFQKIRTVLTRRAMDSLAQSLTSQKAIDANKVEADDIDGLLDNDIGHVVRVKGSPREALMPIETPDISGSALTWLEYTDAKQEQASGATRHNQGIDPKALTKTASGMEMLQSAGLTRIEMYARWLGHALEEIFEHILYLVSVHQDQPRIVRIQGRPVEIDPRTWADDMSVTVHVGLGGETREKKLFNLNLIAQKQEAIMLQAGPSNPLVTIQEYRTTLQRMVETMGFKDASAYFREIPEDYQPPPPGPDPKAMEVQAKMQLEQAKAQADAQLAAQKLQAEQTMKAQDAQTKQAMSAAELQHKARMAEMDAQLQREMAAQKAANEMEIARLRIAAETEIAAQRMTAEMALARWKTEQDMKLQREKIRLDAKAKGVTGMGGSSEDTNVGGFRPGGSLDA